MHQRSVGECLKINMKLKSKIAFGLLSSALCANIAATDRYFGYSYEPETMPEGALEFEQWVTLRTQKTKSVGEDNEVG